MMAPWLCMSAMVLVVMAVSIPRGLSAHYLVLFCLLALWQVESAARRVGAAKDPATAPWWLILHSNGR